MINSGSRNNLSVGKTLQLERIDQIDANAIIEKSDRWEDTIIVAREEGHTWEHF